LNKLINQTGIVVDELMEVYRKKPECAYKALALYNGCDVIKYPDNYSSLPNLNDALENIGEFCKIIEQVVLDEEDECYQEAKRFFWKNVKL